jgi:multidrug efflux pump subunit AcrA (membrane-fusion protein)
MIISIPEDLINLTQYVKGVRVRFDAIPGTEAHATIKEIGAEASQATRTFPVTLIMDPTIGDTRINPGMAGEARAGDVEVPEHLLETGIEVPATAIFSPDGEDPSKTFVWVVDEQTSTVHRREVTPVKLTERGGTLVKGVEPGERIATAGVHRLREGQQVRIEKGS